MGRLVTSSDVSDSSLMRCLAYFVQSVMHYVELGSSAVTETVGSVKSKSAIEVQPCQCKGIDNKKGIRVKWYMPAAAQLKHSSVEE